MTSRSVSLSLVSAIGLLLGLSPGCTGGDEEDVERDFALVTVSGHCFGLDCPIEEYSPEYLDAEGSAAAVARALPDEDGDVDVRAYADSYYSWEDTRTGEIVVYGFLGLVADLEWLRDEWTDDSHRVVVMCHSHGCVWAHTALWIVNDLAVDLLVDLDGESLGWETDVGFGDEWAEVIEDHGLDWPWDIGDAADSWDVDGLSDLQDVEDVVPPSVAYNLEVASNDWPIQDAEPNHYLDGSTRGIERFEADEDHGEVDDVGSEGMDWVLDAARDVLE